MPELPEVETVRRGLEPFLVGRTISKVEQRRRDLRFPFPERFAARLEGRKIDAVGRRAKYLLLDLDNGAVLVMHLGMSGSFRIAGPAEQAPGRFHHARSRNAAHDHVVFHLTGGTSVTYNDPRRFGFMDLTMCSQLSENRFLRDLGIEPVGNELTPEAVARMCAQTRLNLKSFLLDQSKIAGLGNIYVCEALHRSGLSPDRIASTLVSATGRPSAKLVRLCDEIRNVLGEAISAGGSSLRDHQQVDGALGYFQHTFKVYDREGQPCSAPSCRGVVERRVHSGRSTFYCAKCQR